MIRILVAGLDGAFERAFDAHVAAEKDVKAGREDSAAALLDRLAREQVDLVFLSAELPDAMSALERLKRAHPKTEVVVTTALASMEVAYRAMKLGASEYLVQPISPEQVAIAVDRVRRMRRLEEENRRLREQLRERRPASELVGGTGEIQRVREQVARAAASEEPVLFVGEAGTGKRLAALSVHQESSRRDRPFVRVDCRGSRQDALEVELMGAPGRPGALERASGGTVLLEEIAEMPTGLQPALLRAITDHAVRVPVSGSDVAIEARVLATTSRNLLESVGRGTFRHDLFQVLSYQTVALPRLRERLDDVPLLVDAFLKRRKAAGRRAPVTASAEALRTLLAYDWPGNVRELEQAVERACELGSSEMLERRHLPPSVIQAAELRRKESADAIGTQSLREMESEVIQKLLTEHRGNTDVVSKLLKIDRSTLYRKIKRYGIPLDDLKG